jgi:hypothetical protein
MNCGKTINDDSLYCQYCGIVVDKSFKVATRFRSLNEKAKEDLIKIILRKDKTERSNNRKIQELIKELNYYKGLNNSKEL